MLDARVAAIGWLMNPVQGRDLPRKQIIATSYAALNPPESVWRKYLSEIRKLAERGELSEDHVGLLLFAPEARLELMTVTEGDVDAFTEGTIQHVLGHARAAAQAEVRADLATERQRREEAEKRMTTEKARAAEAIAAAAAVTESHQQHVSLTAAKLARVIGWALFALAVALVIAGTGFATSGLFPEEWSNALPFVASLLVVIAVLAGVASLIWGVSLTNIVTGTERVLHHRIERRLAHWLLPPSHERDQ
jgi:hypothetical protein